VRTREKPARRTEITCFLAPPGTIEIDFPARNSCNESHPL
jgi:hypothetical protein